MFIDPIADLIVKIKNASRAKLPIAKIQTSNYTTAILEVLKAEGYIEGFEIKKDKTSTKSTTIINIKYKNQTPSISEIRQISKPGLRIYLESKKLPKVLNGLGIAIVSTSQGVMTDKNARKNNLGGEVVAYVW